MNSLITQSACVYLDLLLSLSDFIQKLWKLYPDTRDDALLLFCFLFGLFLIYIKYLKLLTLEKPILIFHFYK
jgi:uncharacterized membrane protein YoaT (DUF817 family)